MRHFLRWFPLAVLLAALLAVGSWGSSTTSEAATSNITVTLSGSNEVPPVAGAGSATATFQFDDQTNQLSYTLTIQGVAPVDVTGAHIHLGGPGVSGPVLHPLTVSKSSSTTTGTVTLSAAEVGYLKQGSLYVNVHSVEHPGGFARAQLMLDAEAQIRARVADIIQAFNSQDGAAFLNGFTDNGLTSTFGFSSRDEAEQSVSFIFNGTLAATVNSVAVNGSTATVDMTLNFGNYLEHDIDAWVLQGGEWRIDNTTITSVPIPSGTRTVNLTLQEYAFVYDKASVADGNFAFSVTNAGSMQHEIDLVKIPAGMTTDQLLQALQQGGPDAPLPAGVDPVASVGPFDPGTHGTLVFTHPLESGHYALLCFMPDANGTPHAFLGMVSDFTVGSATAAGTGSSTGSAGSITPPNTGDAGLKSDGVATNDALLVAALLVVFTTASTFELSRRTNR